MTHAPWRSAAITGLGVIVAGLVIGRGAVVPANRAHRTALAESRAHAVADTIDARLESMRASVEQMAQSTAAARALAAGDRTALTRLEQRYAQALPHALRVRLLAPGTAEAALDAQPALTFAGLDLIRRAEQGDAPPAEVVPGGDAPTVNIAVAVRAEQGDGAPLGVVFVPFAMTALALPATTRSDLSGRVVVEQHIEADATPVEILRFGGPAAAEAHTIRRALANPHWRLSFRPSPAIARATVVPAWPLAAALLALLAALAFGYRPLLRPLERDLARLLEQVRGLVRGEHPGDAHRFTLDAFSAAHQELKRLAAERVPPRQADAAPPAAQQPRAFRTAAAACELKMKGVRRAAYDHAPDCEFDTTTGETSIMQDARAPTGTPPAEIFRAYDVRGIVDDTLTESGVRAIGRAVGSDAAGEGETTVVVGRDGRHSSARLGAAVSEGLRQAGADVIDIGEVPTPVLYYATHVLGSHSGIMITGSHNPPEYNGLKMVVGGETLAEARIQALRERIESQRFSAGAGQARQAELMERYVQRIVDDIALAQPLKVVVDCGNGIAGKVAPALFEAIGCEVVPLYCEVDGDFPNHHPDPADPANMVDLVDRVCSEGADLGLAFDGDGDRLGVVTERGSVVWPDRLLMLFCRDIVGRNPGADIIYDVKCSRHLGTLITEYGGRPIMWRTGHSHIKAKIKETGALLGGEFSGHICFGERWYGFDDALYSAARLLEIVGADTHPASESFAAFPATVNTPEIKIETTEASKFAVVEQLAEHGDFDDGTMTVIDGVRVDYADGWGLIRPSNTSPVLTLRFEADDQTALERVQTMFRRELAKVDPTLEFQA